MRPVEIENWALRIIEMVEKGQPNEDARVELKADWIDPRKAARRLAGHANASRGDAILWLIGVDQENGVKGAIHSELSNWYLQVVAEFDGVAPTMTDVNVPHNGVTVAALYFETDRAPYVVKNPQYGAANGSSIALEVPWRDGTRVRTAKREDLIRLLVPVLSTPDVEILSGELTVTKTDDYHWHLAMGLYIIPHNMALHVIPRHKCEGHMYLTAGKLSIVLSDITLVPLYTTMGRLGGGRGLRSDSHTIYSTQSELIVEGPGRINLSAIAFTGFLPEHLEGSTVDVHIKLLPVHANRPIVLDAQLLWDSIDRHPGHWSL